MINILYFSTIRRALVRFQLYWSIRLNGSRNSTDGIAAVRIRVLCCSNESALLSLSLRYILRDYVKSLMNALGGIGIYSPEKSLHVHCIHVCVILGKTHIKHTLPSHLKMYWKLNTHSETIEIWIIIGNYITEIHYSYHSDLNKFHIMLNYQTVT